MTQDGPFMEDDGREITLERRFYALLVATQKAMVARLGGSVDFTADELLAASAKTCRSSFDGEPDEWREGTWNMTLRDEDPPAEPEDVDA